MNLNKVLFVYKLNTHRIYKVRSRINLKESTIFYHKFEDSKTFKSLNYKVIYENGRFHHRIESGRHGLQ